MSEPIAIPAFKDNYMWVLGADGNDVAVVDPGEAGPVIDWLEAHDKRLVAILITHHHPDHVGGVRELVERYSPRVHGPDDDRVPALTQRLNDGDRVEVPELGLSFEAIAVPGHTRSHTALYGGGRLFSGDTLFAAGCGRLFEGDPAQMHASLSRLAALPGETRVYCGHEYTLANLRFASRVEPDNQRIHERLAEVQAQRERGENTLPSTIALELETNVFLRPDQPSVIQHAEQWAGQRLDSPQSVFGAVRRWKDTG